MINNLMDKKLHIGCGENKLNGYINVDIDMKYKPDMCFDASEIKNYYRFKDESIEEIKSEYFLEHISNAEEVMKEWHRILKQDGLIKIKVPHFSRGFTNPTHKIGFDISWILHFNKNNKYSTYVGVEYTPIKIKLKWIDFLEHYPCNRITKFFLYILNKSINLLANISPHFCSRIWCFWVGGFEGIYMELQKNE